MTIDERRGERSAEPGGPELDRRIAGLPREVEPARDLWPAIEARLDEETPSTGPAWGRWGAIAAAIAAAALLPLLLSETPVQEPPPAVVTVPEATSPVFDTAGQRLRLRNAATTRVQPGPEYQAARAELLGRLEQRLEGLAPAEREIVVTNLEAIRRALEEIDTALQASPDDPLLQELMLKSYQSELDVINRVNGLAGPVRRRTDL